MTIGNLQSSGRRAAAVNDSKIKRRWCNPQPAWLVLLSLATTDFLFASEWYQWYAFNQHKGCAVLIAMASVAAMLVILLLWWIAALALRWLFQFSVMSLLVLVVAVAMPCAWTKGEMKKAKRQRRTIESIQTAIDGNVDLDCERGNSMLPSWSLSLLGADFFGTPDCANCGSENGADNDVARLSELPTLRALCFENGDVTDDGLKCLDGLKRLQVVQLMDCYKVTDAGLEHFNDLTKLVEIELRGTPIVGYGLKHLKRLNNLQKLGLEGTKIGDNGMAYVADLHQLESLDLSYTRITDEGLKLVATMKRLQRLTLEGTNVTAHGVDTLQQALPNCHITWFVR
jgi:hypothetical protein